MGGGERGRRKGGKRRVGVRDQLFESSRDAFAPHAAAVAGVCAKVRALVLAEVMVGL